MIKVSTNGTAERSQGQYNSAAQAISPSGLAPLFQAALLQLQRFTLGNIEVDTGRTKNSIFAQLDQSGNSIAALLGTSVRYAPYVRQANGGVQFFTYAADVEGPAALAALGDNVILAVSGEFD